MQQLIAPMHSLSAFEEHVANFQITPLTEIMAERYEVPIFLALGYIAFVFWGQDFMATRKPMNLKPFFIMWNVFLAIFSLAGAVYLVPALTSQIAQHGLRSTVCGSSWYKNGTTGYWVALFVLSKVPEFVDTLFLVFQKKPVIFLHWYHHFTVMLYCWNAYVLAAPAGSWFATMNYCVHGIMYSYYALMSQPIKLIRRCVKPVAPLITFLQISQMIVGFLISMYLMSPLAEGADCEVPVSNNRLCFAMYASYFVLFARLFYNNYILKKPKKASPPVPSPGATAMKTKAH